MDSADYKYVEEQRFSRLFNQNPTDLTPFINATNPEIASAEEPENSDPSDSFDSSFDADPSLFQDGNAISTPQIPDNPNWFNALIAQYGPAFSSNYQNLVSDLKNMSNMSIDQLYSWFTSSFSSCFPQAASNYFPFIFEQALIASGNQPAAQQASDADGILGKIENAPDAPASITKILGLYSAYATQVAQDRQTLENTPDTTQWAGLEAKMATQLQGMKQNLVQALGSMPSIEQDLQTYIQSHPDLLKGTGFHSAAAAMNAINPLLSNQLTAWFNGLSTNAPAAFVTPANWQNPQNFPDSSIPASLAQLYQELDSGVDPSTGKPLTPDQIIQIREQIAQEASSLYSIPSDGQDLSGKDFPPSYCNPRIPDPAHPGQFITLDPSMTHWDLSQGQGFIPTNDWAENFALPTVTGTNLPVGLGPYTGYMTDNGVQYQLSSGYTTVSDPKDPQHYIITESQQGPQFSIGSSGNYNSYTMSMDGSGMRAIKHVSSTDPNSYYIEYISPDQLLASTSYTNADVSLQINGTPLSSIQPEQVTLNGQAMNKYVINTTAGTYVFYTKPDCNLTYNAQTKALVSSGPYTGFIQGGALPVNPNYPPSAEDLKNAEAAMDAGAGVVITHMDMPFMGQGSAINTECVDLSGNPSAGNPAILLNYSQQQSLCADKGVTQTNAAYETLTGSMRVVLGGNIRFSQAGNLPTSTTLVSQDPSTYTDAQLSQLAAQFQATGNDADIMNNFQNMDIYTSGKLIQKLATRMEIGQLLLKAEAQGRTVTPPITAQDVQQKYTNLVSCVEQTSHKFGIDNFGVLAGSSHDDYGDNYSSNDRIIHIGYLLNGFAAAIQYENDNNMPASQRFENQSSGIGNSTYGQVAKTFLNNVLNPQNPRQFSAPDGHSWLSGMTAMADGDNTESDSEALNGDLGAYRLANAFADIPNAPDRDQWLNYAQYAQTLSATEAQASRNLWQVDGSNPGLYAPGFGNDNNFSATNIFNDKVDNDTWWGSNWATRLSIGLLPVNEQQVNSLLYGPDGKPTQWTIDAANFIMKNFNPNDPTGGTGPGDGGFIAYAAVIVGAAEGGNSPDAQALYNWCVQHNQFDNGIDALGLAQILDYETNKKAAADQSASAPIDPINSASADSNGIQV